MRKFNLHFLVNLGLLYEVQILLTHVARCGWWFLVCMCLRFSVGAAVWSVCSKVCPHMLLALQLPNCIGVGCITKCFWDCAVHIHAGGCIQSSCVGDRPVLFCNLRWCGWFLLVSFAWGTWVCQGVCASVKFQVEEFASRSVVCCPCSVASISGAWIKVSIEVLHQMRDSWCSSRKQVGTLSHSVVFFPTQAGFCCVQFQANVLKVELANTGKSSRKDVVVKCITAA